MLFGKDKSENKIVLHKNIRHVNITDKKLTNRYLCEKGKKEKYLSYKINIRSFVKKN